MKDADEIDQACVPEAFDTSYNVEICCCCVETDEEEGNYDNPCEQWDDACCC